MFIAYILILLRLTVFRPNMSFRNLFSGRINERLFREYLPLLRHGYWMRSIYLFGGNIVCFIPFGMYLQGCTGWKLTAVTAMGLLFSLIIETLQYVLGTGVSELDDLILNALGTFIGALCVRGWMKRQIEKPERS